MAESWRYAVPPPDSCIIADTNKNASVFTESRLSDWHCTLAVRQNCVPETRTKHCYTFQTKQISRLIMYR